MKLNIISDIFPTSIDGHISRLKANKQANSSFETEMYNSALNRLQTAIQNKDMETAVPTIEILLDFANDEVKSIINDISKHTKKSEYDQAGNLLSSIAR